MTVGNEIAYYLRPVNGSDSNDGKSFGGAWKTWQKVIDEMCVSGVTSNNAALFLVNEGGAYTGPWHTGTGDTIAVPDIFTSDKYVQICGLSADGSHDPQTNFEFDLSGFTGTSWLNVAGGGPHYKEVMFRNITWKNANNIDSIIYQNYFQNMANTSFVKCNFEDNECTTSLIRNYAFAQSYHFDDCNILRNNTYSSSYALFNSATSLGNRVANYYKNCIFESNQTSSTSSNYVVSVQPSSSGVYSLENCLFFNNGYNTDDICYFFRPYQEHDGFNISNCIFFNNSGTAIYAEDANQSDPDYSFSTTEMRVKDSIFMLNNKSIDIEVEPGLRQTYFSNNVFYNNTVEDIPDIIETLPGISGGNHVFDPEFTNGYSGDFSVPHDSRLFSYSTVPGIPIGGSFVQKRSFQTTDSGTFALGTGGIGDTVTVSGRSFQKVDDDPIVWRRI